ncbi:MAG: hypothetical protein J7M05_04150 [Anaerolineae bacterium]|nr:hypothetical protein [Anaerolineae bacterium]
MNTAFIFVIGIALIILLIPLAGIDYQIKRIVRFQRRRFKGHPFKSPSLPFALSERKKQGKLQVPLTDIRDLVVSLQLGTSLEATLTGSLVRAAEQFAERGVLGERLRRHVESRISISPQAVIEGLIEDLDCPQLEEVLERIRMAEDGGISYHRALGVSVEAIEEDIRAAVEQEVQKAPIRLTLPMVAGVFLPALILGLIPLLMVGISQMRGP